MALGGFYKTGTLSVNAAATAVTGVGTAWSVNDIMQGDTLMAAGLSAFIDSVTDDTHLVLESGWPGAVNLSAASYVIGKTSWLRYDPALSLNRLSQFLNSNVFKNVPWPVVGAYPVANADKGKTIRAGGAASYAVTFAAASGYDTDFAVLVLNEDTTLEKSIVLTGGDTFTLAAGGTVLVYAQNGVWRSLGFLPRRRFVFEGDSLSNTANHGTWPTLLATASGFFSRGTVSCVAADGETIATIVGEYASQIAPLKPVSSLNDECWLFVWAGTNDIGLTTDTAATIYNNLKTEWAAAKADGFKVVASTVMNFGTATGAQVIRLQALNALILSDTSLYDYVMRPDVWFPDPADTYTFISDTVHLTDAGNRMMAEKVAELIAGSQVLPAQPHDGMPGGILLNGEMKVSQWNGATSGSTTGYVPADCYKFVVTAGYTASVQQVTDAPPGFANSVKVTMNAATASPASGDLLGFAQQIEGYRIARLKRGLASGQWATVAFFVKCSVAPLSLALWNANDVPDRSYSQLFTIATANVWQFVRLFIPPDVIGTWASGNTLGSYLEWVLSCGSSLQGTAGIWNAGFLPGVTGQGNFAATNGATIQFSGAVMVPGAVFLTPEAVLSMMRPFPDTLDLCKRYWEASYEYGTAPATNTLTGVVASIAYATNVFTGLRFNKEKRTAPTMSLWSKIGTAGVWSNSSNADIAATSANTVATKGIAAFVSSGLTVGAAYWGHWVADAKL